MLKLLISILFFGADWTVHCTPQPDVISDAINKSAALAAILALVLIGLFLLFVIRYCLKAGEIGSGPVFTGGTTFRSTQPKSFFIQILFLGLLSFKALSLAILCLAFLMFPDFMKPIIIAHTC